MGYCLAMRRRIGFSVSGACLLLTATAALLAAAPLAAAAPGDLDPSFGKGGTVRLLPSHEDIALRGVATQPDGKIVLVGGDHVAEATIVVRLLEDGALDPSFGSGGIVHLQLGSEGSEGRAVVIQPDGRIVLAGEAKGATDYDFAFARLDPDGALDPSFGGGDGKLLLPVGPEGDRAEALALGPGGRLVAVGEANYAATERGAGVAVLGPNGLPDPGYFGSDGVTVETTAPKGDEGVAVAMLADGRVLLADGNGAGFTLIRLLAPGTRDPSFGGGDGLVEQVVPGPENVPGQIADIALLPDGRIVASGVGYDYVAPKYEPKLALARFLPDGQLDASFGSSGFFTRQVGLESESAEGVQVTPGGKLVIAGPYTAAIEPAISDGRLLARLDPNGALDPGFGAGGFALSGVTAPFGENFEGSALDYRERLVYAGRAYIGSGNTEVVVSRYLGDVPPDPSGPAGRPAPPPRPAPHARMKKISRKLAAPKLKRFSGTASDRGGRVAKVQIALLRLPPRGAGARAGRTCQALRNTRARFKVVRAKRGKPCPRRWLNAAGKAKWRFELKATLPPGHYVVFARAVDASGIAESSFSRAAGNRYSFRLFAPPRRHPR